MRDGWETTTLGEVADRMIGRTPPRRDHRYWTSDLSYPFFTIADMTQRIVGGGREGVTELAVQQGKAKCVPAGSLLLSFKLSVGKVAITTADLYPNEAIAWVKPRPGVLQEFLALALEGVEWSSLGGRAVKGKTLNATSLDAVPLTLPPLDEQRRIVDLIGALDDTIEATHRGAASAERVLELLRAEAAAGDERPLGDYAVMRSGPSWKSAEESSVPVAGAVPVLGIGNTPKGERIDLTDRKYVRGVADSALRLSPTSLVMIRTNGNRSRIGNIYRAIPEVEGFAVSAFQIAIQPHDAGASDFLYWYLGSPEVQQRISENASGSTGLGNVAIGWLKAMSVPVLEPRELADYVERCEAALDVLHGLQDQAAHLRTLRSNLLTALLSGEHEIPSSYDEVAEELVA